MPCEAWFQMFRNPVCKPVCSSGAGDPSLLPTPLDGTEAPKSYSPPEIKQRCHRQIPEKSRSPMTRYLRSVALLIWGK